MLYPEHQLLNLVILFGIFENEKFILINWFIYYIYFIINFISRRSFELTSSKNIILHAKNFDSIDSISGAGVDMNKGLTGPRIPAITGKINAGVPASQRDLLSDLFGEGQIGKKGAVDGQFQFGVTLSEAINDYPGGNATSVLHDWMEYAYNIVHNFGYSVGLAIPAVLSTYYSFESPF